MIRNEKGFTYPLTFCVILLFSVLLTVYIEQFLAEKRLYREAETVFKQEYYFLCSVIHVENEMQQLDENALPTGNLIFTDGEVEYGVEKLTDNQFKVSFNLRMEDLPIVLGFGYYDKEVGKMIKWIEKN
ncbi:hypothetical protein KDN24_09735 [Bacillus sp. Bva_UNVM-123]|uniref:competence type IV pilus minor pilin ComGG n=1 Tax=Bacillus sp. Bva_UNVM-123 TaxID=2829798 RepID=UPI00391F6832